MRLASIHQVRVSGTEGDLDVSAHRFLVGVEHHLLMEIVVKQDQVEVPLQALKRPLLDTVLAAASLRGRDPEGPAVKMGQLRSPNLIPGS